MTWCLNLHPAPLSPRRQGETTFNGRNLHQIGPEPNHYEIAISTIGRTLAKFDDDNMIPVYGFGDSRTTDKQVSAKNIFKSSDHEILSLSRPDLPGSCDLEL